MLTNVEKIAPCLPGAQLKEVEGDQYRGIVKVKVGPVTAGYHGSAQFLQLDHANHRAVLKAEGRETRGQGDAAATITATLTPSASGTDVEIMTDLEITGKVAHSAAECSRARQRRSPSSSCRTSGRPCCRQAEKTRKPARAVTAHQSRLTVSEQPPRPAARHVRCGASRVPSLSRSTSAEWSAAFRPPPGARRDHRGRALAYRHLRAPTAAHAVSSAARSAAARSPPVTIASSLAL